MNKKPLFQQVMTRSDWVKLGILIIFSAGCWAWIWYESQKPIDYNQIVDDIIANQPVQIIIQGDQKIVKNKIYGYQVTVPKEWNVDRKNPEYLAFSNKNTFTPLELGEDGILYDIIVYKTDKNLQNWINQKDWPSGTITNETPIIVNGIEGIRQRVDQNQIAIGEGNEIIYKYYFKIQNNLIEISDRSASNLNSFENFIETLKQ